MKTDREPARVLAAVVAIVCLLTMPTVSVRAQQTAAPAFQTPPTAPPAKPSKTAPAAFVPPVIQFPAEGITLDEAVRLTLTNDPSIRKAAANERLQAGVAEEQQGAFDYSIGGNGAYNYQVQQLTSTQEQEEQDKRTALQSAITNDGTTIQSTQQLLSLLQQVQAAPPGSQQVAALAQISPTIAGTVQVIDQLIGSPSIDAATRASLQTSRAQFIQDSINATQSALTTDNAPCPNLAQADTTILSCAQTGLSDLGPAPIDQVFINSTLGLTLNKALRNGISYGPFFDGTFQRSNFKGKPSNPLFGGQGIADVYTLHAGVNFGVPLLRGLGARSADAAERAARLEQTAAHFDLLHQMASSVLATVLAYWDLRAAQENLDIATRASDYQTQLMNVTQGRIGAGEVPRVELARVQAATARAQAQLQSARTNVQNARIALASALGVASTGDDATLPRARDEFPDPPPADALPPAANASLVGTALDSRRDLASAGKTEDASNTLAVGAKLDQKPLLNLTLGTFYTALGQGSFGQAANRWVGPSTALSFDFERPFGNNTQIGLFLQRQAEAEQSHIATVDLGRQISLDVLQATSTLAETIAQVQQAQSAVGFYQTMIDAETNRFRTGDATLIDTVTTQQQQVDALAALVVARQSLAKQIAQLRFNTGTLVSDGQVKPGDLTTLPPIVRRQP